MNALLFFGAAFASAWMVQLRANFVTVFGDSVVIPDLVCLLSAMAGYYLPRSQATAFVVLCAAFSDLASDLRFGLLSFRDAMIVQALWPMRALMWRDSRISLFIYLFSFVGCQKLCLTILILVPTSPKDVLLSLPKIIIVSVLTGIFGVISQGAFEAFLGRKRNRR